MVCADLIVLTEFKNNDSGKHIADSLYREGYIHHIRSSESVNKNGVGVFAKDLIERKSIIFFDNENTCSILHNGMTYICTFCANDDVTSSFLNDIEKLGFQINTVIIGDLNTGPRGSKPNRYEDLNRLVKCGYKDIWRIKHTDICWSFQFGNGKSQPDHAFSSNDIDINNSNVDFDLSPIFEGLSDHGMMVLEL